MIVQYEFSRDATIRYCFRIFKNNNLYLNGREVHRNIPIDILVHRANIITQEEL